MKFSHIKPGFVAALLALPLASPASSASPEPAGVSVAAAAGADRVYVADFDADRIRILSPDGAFLGEWGATGTGPGEFRGPAGIAVGRDGSVYVADHLNGRVQRFTAGGRFLAAWPAGDESAAPIGIVVDGAGRVLTTDLLAGRVRVWSPGGEPVGEWGESGRGPHQLLEPWGIACAADGDVLVADHGNHRIQRFSADGEWRESWASGGDAGAVLGPMGIETGRDGTLLVTDLDGGRLLRLAPDGAVVGAVSTRLESGALVPDVVAAPDGALLVLDAQPGRLVRLAGLPAPSPGPVPDRFALLPVTQSLGRGPVVLELAIPARGTARIEFFSPDGRRVRRLPPAEMEAGIGRVTWDARTDDGHRAPVGVYFVRVQFEDGIRSESRSARVVVLR